MEKLKNERGAITLIVLVTMLFIVSVLISMYLIVANKVQGQIERTEELKKIYNNVDEAEDIYNSYFAGDTINIYTAEQLLKIGLGEDIEINGKIYNFSKTATYVFMNDIEFDVDDYAEILGEGTDWTPIGETDYQFEGNGRKILVTKVDDTIVEYNKENFYKDLITATTMQSNLASYLGQTVNYGVTYGDQSTYGNNEWEIFYVDENNIYIITKGHLAEAALSITGYNGTVDFTAADLESKYPAVAAGLLEKTYDPTSVGSELKYESDYDNMKATQYLLDSSLDSTNWSTYVNSSLADWAIGGPTLELFVKSYNTFYPDKEVTISTPIDYGYLYNDDLYTSDSIPQGTYLNHYTTETPSPTAYWLACPASRSDNLIRYVSGNRTGVFNSAYSNSYAFRPVVCLNTNVCLTWNDTTSQYDLSLPN